MSQVLGTFSEQRDHFQITTNGLSFFDDKPNAHVESIGENQYEKIPDSLIKECNDNYEKTGIPQIILDYSDKLKISKLRVDLSEERNTKIHFILDTKFEVVSWHALLEMPSLQTLYDSVTKHTNLFERHKKVLDFLNSLDFKIVDLLNDVGSISQQELLFNSFHREISYMSSNSPRIIIRVKPNLMIEMIVFPVEETPSSKTSYHHSGTFERHFFFYSPSKIITIITENSSVKVKRDLIRNLSTF